MDGDSGGAENDELTKFGRRAFPAPICVDGHMYAETCMT